GEPSQRDGMVVENPFNIGGPSRRDEMFVATVQHWGTAPEGRNVCRGDSHAHPPPAPAIHRSIFSSNKFNGTVPDSNTLLWNSPILNSSPKAASARLRSSRIFSWPILYDNA